MFCAIKTCNMFQNLVTYFDFSKKISKKLATHHHKSCCLGQDLQNELSYVASFDKKWKHVTCFQKHVTCFHQIPFFPTAEDKNKFSNVLPDRFGYYGAIIIQNIAILTWVVKKNFLLGYGMGVHAPFKRGMQIQAGSRKFFCFYDAKHVTCFKILLNISIFLKKFQNNLLYTITKVVI